MAEAFLTSIDLIALLQGRVVYRDDGGQPCDPPSGTSFARRHAIEIAINPTHLDALQQMISPKFWETPFFQGQIDE